MEKELFNSLPPIAQLVVVVIVGVFGAVIVGKQFLAGLRDKKDDTVIMSAALADGPLVRELLVALREVRDCLDVRHRDSLAEREGRDENTRALRRLCSQLDQPDLPPDLARLLTKLSNVE